MKKHRLFIATFAQTKNFGELKKRLAILFNGKFVKRKNLHITYKFLADVEDPQQIIQLLDGIKYDKSVKIKFQKLKLFRKKFVILRSSNKTIYKIHDTIEQKLQGKFIRQKNFKPHITLMKIKSINDNDFKEKLKQLHFEAFVNFKICLVESYLVNSHVKYKILREF
ncbi:MAG: RNA 2',3'-cyclic phosphodiesterase [Campylobacterales bacterium]|nr:RNA 2',3'-cyclic phosphodiesterase [Campylobacterales bacterium]